jgi:hypothetical protein
METRSGADTGTRFALWHIPSSTLLVTTTTPGDVVRRIESVVAEGIGITELMLNVEHGNTVAVDQHLGTQMLRVLHDAR